MAEYNIHFDWNRISTLGKVKVLVEQVVGQPSQEAINTAVAEYIDSHPGSLSPLSAATKAALLQIAEKVAYIDENGQDYYNALDAALSARALLQITAVYTQSGTVYDTDSLDSLKADLVVTAYYDDGTTANVTALCTLSGTLTVGTSTITATYDGKSATFDVTVTDVSAKPLPSGYTRYDYIQATKQVNLTNQQRIQLNSYPNLDGFSYDLRLAITSDVTKGTGFWGVRPESNWLSSYALYMSNDDADHIRTVAHGQYMLYDTAFVKGTPFNLKFRNPPTSPATLQIDDGTVQSYEWTTAKTTTGQIMLFTNVMDSQQGTMTLGKQIGTFRLYDENMATVGYYVPVVNSSNRIGMYDLATDTFCTSVTASYTTVGNTNCPFVVGNWS